MAELEQVPAECSPVLIAQQGQRAGDVAVLCELVLRDPQYADHWPMIRTLQTAATSMAQAATVYGAVPVGRFTLVYLPARLTFAERLVGACHAFVVILRGRPARGTFRERVGRAWRVLLG